MKKKIVFTIICMLTINCFAYNVVSLTSVDKIRSFNGKSVEPIVYKIEGIDLNKLEVKKKKNEFIKVMLPSILLVKEELSNIQSKVMKLSNKSLLTIEEKKFIEDLMERYKVKNDISELINRLNTVPVDLVLAQAIIESGWGTSRFFKEGNNCFGAWTYRMDLPRIESKEGVRNGKKVYLRKFTTIKASVENHFYNLAVGSAYTELRKVINETDNYLEITKTLGGYSEKGNEYGKFLNSIIKYNKLSKYNMYSLLKG